MSLRITSVYVWVVVLLACLEVALQYRAHQRGWEAPLFRSTAASAAAIAEEKPVRYGPTAAFPFRSEIVSQERPADTLRLWVASASHAEDIYLGVEETFPAQAGRLLNASLGVPRWQVLNASRAGNLIATNAADLSRLGRDWQPSVVVLYQMSMEVVDLSRKHLGSSGPAESHNEEEPVEPRRESAVGKAAADTTVYTTLKANITPWIASQRVLAPDLGEAAEQDFESRVRDFLRAVRETGALPVLCTFATSHGQQDAKQLPRDVRQFMLRYNRYLSPEGWTRAIARGNAIIRRVASEESVVLVDCEQAMTGNAQHFRDYVHFSREGHRRIAELLSEKLLSPSMNPSRPLSTLRAAAEVPEVENE